MTSEIKIFEHEELGKIRTIIRDDEPWFVGKDVAEILGYSNTRDALSRHVDEEDKGVGQIDTLGGRQELVIINESGLYSLILRSTLPSAKAFKRWVTKEVLPSIRKTGSYSVKTEEPPLDLKVLPYLTRLAEKATRNKYARAVFSKLCKDFDININVESEEDKEIEKAYLAKFENDNYFEISRDKEIINRKNFGKGEPLDFDKHNLMARDDITMTLM